MRHMSELLVPGLVALSCCAWSGLCLVSTYVSSLYPNPDSDDRIFDCLLTSMAAVQAEDVRASFLFVGNLNGHHHEWLGFTTTNRHGAATFYFVTVSGCDELVVGPTQAHDGTLDLLITDVPKPRTGCCCSIHR